ncbi:MAG: nucleotidyltransferase domain-containing protein [Phycisphaeraceae bacterium]
MDTTAIAQVDDRLLAEVVRRLRTVGDPLKVVLFGSYARGTPHEHSDMDLLIVEPKQSEGEIRRSTMYRMALMGLPFRNGIDVLVYSPEEVEDWSTASMAFLTTALREGKVIYERLAGRDEGVAEQGQSRSGGREKVAGT